MTLPLLDEANFAGKAVLLRLDLNVPFKDGNILDTTRLEQSKPTIAFLVKGGAKIIILGHFGRPNGQNTSQYSLRQLIPGLEKLIGKKIKFLPNIAGQDMLPLVETLKIIEDMQAGDIALLENTRFYQGEESNDPLFAKCLAAYGAIYVNDAFSVSHRSHASVDKITDFLPSFAGFSLKADVEALERALDRGQRPVVAIVGGAKVSTKIALLENLVTKVDALVVGGGMANSFLAAVGVRIGKSLCEPNIAPITQRILEKARKNHCTVLLPIDATIAYRFEANAPHQLYHINSIPSDGMILDIGEHSIERIKAVLDTSKTLLWNGPLGAFEISPFDKATNSIAQYAGQRTKDGKLISIAGGGDTIFALKKANAIKDFTHVSTAGGAFLEWLEGKTLPGIAALERQAEIGL